MTRVTKKGGTTIERKIHVGVVTVHPYEIMTNVLASLLEKGKLLPITAGLTDREMGINTNTSFHTFKDVDTKIHVCSTCKCRLLSFAAAVHRHEIHTVHIDGGGDEE